jgi:hypothetical protein
MLHQLATWHFVNLCLKQSANSRVQLAKLKLGRIDRNSRDYTTYLIQTPYTQLNFKDPFSSSSYVHCMYLITSHKHVMGILNPYPLRALPIAKQMAYT